MLDVSIGCRLGNCQTRRIRCGAGVVAEERLVGETYGLPPLDALHGVCLGRTEPGARF